MKRKYAPKTKLIRRRRLARRPMRSLALRRPQNVHSFKRSIFYENLFVIPTGTPSGYAFEQKFSQLPNYTEFTAMFDQYMIKKIVLKLIPKINTHNLASTTTGNADLSQVHSAIDYDDATTPTSVQQLCEYQSYKMTRGSQIHTRVLVPKIELTTDGTANAPKAYQWLDCDSPSVNHRGIKVWFSAPSSATTTLYYDMLVQVYFSCKNVV